MEHEDKSLISGWLSLTNAYLSILNELEIALKQNHDLSLNEFYVLLFLFEASEKKLSLNQLQKMVGLSQSTMSRLVVRFEAKGCGALQRNICKEDRRSIYTSITVIGENKLEKAFVTFHNTLENAILQKDIREKLEVLLLPKTK
ncbi:MarR family transcriptional regulator [Bacillaceae bacterium IKA-2]|nr:MarR family transcriptional regulator [Bacillaceae bacterium IKA-2]